MKSRSLHKCLLFILMGLALQSGITLSSLAQDKILSSGELPMMALRVCTTLEAAERQAKISKRLGSITLDAAKATSEKELGCQMMMVRARPLSVESIDPYVSWVATYDKLSPTTLNVNSEGQSHSVNYSYKLQNTKFYRASLTDRNGANIEAWAEIPEKPYMAAFLEEKKRTQVSSWSPDGFVAPARPAAASYRDRGLTPVSNVQKSD